MLVAPALAQGVAAPAADAALATKYAPILRFKEQPSSCGDLVPYEPTDIDLLMGNDEVALRGPWDRTNIVTVAPTAAELSRGLFDYHLDFPGDALRPGCTYREWSARLLAAGPPTTYARVVTERGYPGKLALQYWFFYVFNDWKNNHEGDWEMIQLVFDAATPAQALAGRPVEVGYSQHSSAERADWGDPKLELVGGTHPVVYPATGSQANFFQSKLYLMGSRAEGVGCDNTTEPWQQVRPRVAVVPTAKAAYLRAYPWLGFDGRWGEKQPSFFNGPTGPNEKTQWTQPITWSKESWRSQSFAVPAGGVVGTTATDFFCGAVESGSKVLRQVTIHPVPSALLAGAAVALLLWALSRTVYEPSTPLRIGRRRAWGQILTSSGRMFGRSPRLFLAIGLLFIPVGILITLVQLLVFRVSNITWLVDAVGEQNPFVGTLALALGVLFTLIGFSLVLAATARAMVEIDAGRPVSALGAYRSVLQSWRPLVAALAIAVAVQLVLDVSIVLLPVAVFLLVRWALLAAVVGIERDPQPGVLRRTGGLSRGHWWWTASVLVVPGLALLAGPVVGGLVLLLTGASFDLVNLIAALVYVVALPYAAIVMTYLYFDLRVRQETEPAEETAPDQLVLPI